jgi:Copper type II ascorbate-dependent monooxygenase, C-terminal domain
MYRGGVNLVASSRRFATRVTPVGDAPGVLHHATPLGCVCPRRGRPAGTAGALQEPMTRTSLFFSLAIVAAAACAEPPTASGPVGAQDAVPGGAPTYYQDIHPILQARCTACHKPGEIAPFSLLTFDDARPRAAAIAQATRDRVMPPFPPSTTDCEPLEDPRMMSDAERDLLERWAAAGALEGDSSHPAPDMPVASEILGEPTDTFSTNLDYTPAPPAGEADDYHCFLIDPKLTDAIPYHAADVAPSNRAIAHHATIYVASSPASIAAARALDDAEPGPGYTCFGDSRVPGVDDIGGWVPGEPPQAFPARSGSFVPAGAVFVVQMHYNVAAAGGVDRATVRLWRPTEPIAQLLEGFDVDNESFRVPPHAAASASAVARVIPATGHASDSDMKEGLLWQVGLHAHLQAKSIRMDLVHADGSKQCLLNIPQWQFHWQGSYGFANPVRLVPNDLILITCRWDNTTDHVLTYGNASSDEMCQGWGNTTAR